MIDQLTILVKKEKRQPLIDFLKTLDAAQKKELVPGIKKLNKELSDWKQDFKGNVNRVGSAMECELALTASFVCMNRGDYEKVFSPYWIVEPGKLEPILDWYCPAWFNEFVNKSASAEFVPFHLSYDWMMKLYQQGYLEPSPELLAKQLVSEIFARVNNVHVYQPENLEKYPETLDKHIWYLFDYETSVHFSNRWLHFNTESSKERGDWIATFIKYSTAGTIDRSRLLKEALLASNKNFNKHLSGFFSELVMSLEPDTEEIILLQKEIFSTLSSVNSKPVNSALQLIKKVISLKEFDANGFLDYVPVLLSSPTKSVLASTLMVLEKLGKKRSALQSFICEQSLPVFIVADNDVQTRAAKMIQGFATSLDPSFSQLLAPYESAMMSGAKNLLLPILHQNETVAGVDAALKTATHEPAVQLVPIPYPDSFDDFVFFASQAFDNNQSWHLDVLVNELLIRWPTIQGTYIDKLEPALQRALKMTRSDMRAGQGSLDHMLAIFFIDVCVLLVRQYPEQSLQLQQLFKQFDQKDSEATRHWLAIGKDSYYLHQWSSDGDLPFYEPYKLLLLAVLEKLKEGELTPLLSTPTHEPAWIAPEMLVKRLATYQQSSSTPHDIDCQLAVSRCYLKDTRAAIEMAMQQLSGEYLHILLFLLGADDEPKGPFTAESIWICASVAKTPKRPYAAFQDFKGYEKPFAEFSGQYAWKAFVENYQAERYEWKNGSFQTRKEDAQRKTLKVFIEKNGPTPIVKGLKKLVSSFMNKPKPAYKTIYEFMHINTSYFFGDADIRRIILLAPNNPERMVAAIVQQCLRTPDIFSEPVKRALVATLEPLHELWEHMGEMAHLLVGSCLLSADKTVINLAGEIWLSGVSRRCINSRLIGQIMGKQEAIEFAPLKRFTDHVMQALFRVSPLHNQELQVLIEALMVELPDAPIKNLKKLLEIYLELLSANKSEVADVVKPRLAAWRANAGLKKLVEKVEGVVGEE